jgi:OOP family OmpA-OmpF porin
MDYMIFEEDKMKKVFFMIILIMISSFFIPTLSNGEVREGSIEISPFFGYCTGATSRDLCHKDVYGLRLGYFFTSNWELEGAFEGVGGDGATMFHADALYHFMTEKSFNPFIIAGVGGAHVRPIRGNSYETVMADIGVGFKYQLSRNIAFRTEIRDVMTHFQNSFVTAGLTFTFGKKTPKSAL